MEIPRCSIVAVQRIPLAPDRLGRIADIGDGWLGGQHDDCPAALASRVCAILPSSGAANMRCLAYRFDSRCCNLRPAPGTSLQRPETGRPVINSNWPTKEAAEGNRPMQVRRRFNFHVDIHCDLPRFKGWRDSNLPHKVVGGCEPGEVGHSLQVPNNDARSHSA